MVNSSLDFNGGDNKAQQGGEARASKGDGDLRGKGVGESFKGQQKRYPGRTW